MALDDDLPDDAKAIGLWTHGLGLMFPLALLAAAATATYGVFRKTRKSASARSRRQLAYLLSAASPSGNQMLLYRVVLPALGLRGLSARTSYWHAHHAGRAGSRRYGYHLSTGARSIWPTCGEESCW